MKDFRSIVNLLLCASVALTGTAAAQSYGVAARVNGTAISGERLERYTEEYMRDQGVNIGSIRRPERFKRLKREALDLLVNQELLWQAAKKQKIVVSDAEVDEYFNTLRGQFPTPEAFVEKLRSETYTEATYRQYLRESLSAQKYANTTVAGKIKVSDADVSRFYHENLDRLRRPEEIRARHILRKLDPGAGADAKDAARKELEELLAEARAGADFAGLAAKHSQDTTASAGGDLGFFGRGAMVAAFEEAAFRLKVGETSPVVETEYGLHLIRVEARRGGDVPSEEQVREPLRKLVHQKSTQTALKELIEKLRQQAKIEILLQL